MITDGAKDVGKTALHRNPFAILGATYTSSRGEIIQLADDRSFSMDETVVQDARRALTTPSLRLRAEIGWLPEMDPGMIREILAPRGIDRILRAGVDHPLAHANLVAAELESLVNIPVQGWASDKIRLLSLSAQGIKTESIHELIATIRKSAGFPNVEVYEVREALSSHRAYFRDVGSQFLERFGVKERARVLENALLSSPKPQVLLHEWIDEFEFESRAQVEQLIRTVRSNIKRAEVCIDSTEPVFMLTSAINDLINGLDELDTLVYPILGSKTSRGWEYEPPHRYGYNARTLAVRIANQRHEYDLAKSIFVCLLNLRCLDADIRSSIQKDVQQVNIMASRRNQIWRDPGTQPTPAPGPAAVRSDKRDSSSWFWKLVGILVVLAIGRVLIMQGDTSPATSSQLVPTSPPDRAITVPTQATNGHAICSGIDPWWDDSLARAELAGNIYDSLNPYDSDVAWNSAIIRIESLITQQRQDTAPLVARGLKQAYVDYMQFLVDTLEGNYPSDYLWDLENDRVYSLIESQSRSVADICGFTLVSG